MGQKDINDSKNMRVSSRCALVLGGKGLLGQALVAKLQTEGWHVSTMERNQLRALGQDAETLYDPETLTRNILELAPDVIFNTMAWTQVDAAEEHPAEALAVNSGLPALLGRIAKTGGIRLVHYSTDFVFDGTKQTPYLETDVTNPQSVYGTSKLAGEQALLALELPECLILRTAWLFGPGKPNFITKMLSLADERPQLNVVHDQIGSPSYTPDVAAASLRLLEKNASGIVHVVNAGQASWCELTAEAVRQANKPAQVCAITTNEWPTPAKRPAYSVLSTARYEALTGEHMRSWTQALSEFIYSVYI